MILQYATATRIGRAVSRQAVREMGRCRRGGNAPATSPLPSPETQTRTCTLIPLVRSVRKMPISACVVWMLAAASSSSALVPARGGGGGGKMGGGGDAWEAVRRHKALRAASGAMEPRKSSSGVGVCGAHARARPPGGARTDAGHGANVVLDRRAHKVGKRVSGHRLRGEGTGCCDSIDWSRAETVKLRPCPSAAVGELRGWEAGARARRAPWTTA